MDWSNLPDVILIEIYSYLKDDDRLRMSLTCKRWNQLFNTPVLWRVRRVCFAGVHAVETAKTELDFFRSLGKHVRILVLSFGMPSLRTVKYISCAADYFLKQLLYLPDLKVSDFILDNANLERHWHFWISKNRVVGALSRALRRFRNLHVVNMISFRASLPEGCRVLEALAKGYACRTLKQLFIDDFFHSNLLPVRYKRFVNAMIAFKNLTQIFTNYCLINAEILNSFCDNLGGKFHKLSLSIESDVSRFVIPTCAWKRFSRLCRNARVAVYVYAIGSFYDVTPGLVNGIPLKELHAVSRDIPCRRRTATQGQIIVLLEHILQTYSKTIEKLTLHFERNPNIDDIIIEVLTTCKLLHHVDLQCKLSISAIQDICSLQAQGKMNLYSLRLNINGLTQRQLRQLSTVRVNLVDYIRGGSEDQ